jgi:ABC-type multidrug transport system ATPase subunit
VLDVVGLDGRGGDRFGQYSLGMKQRLGIAAALLGDAELLVLDEPTNGLDPAGINEIRQFILELADGERAVLVSSHIVSELEHISDWLIIINEGTLLYRASRRVPREGSYRGRSFPNTSRTSIGWPRSSEPMGTSLCETTGSRRDMTA